MSVCGVVGANAGRARRRCDRVRADHDHGAGEEHGSLSHRFPLNVEAVGSLRVSSISIDCEVVVCGDDDGVSDFDRLHSQGWDGAGFLFAFDVLEIDGDDLRQEPLERRKAHLEKVLAKAPVGIQFNEHVEFDDVTVFEAACKMGLEGSSRSGATSPIRAASLRAGSSSRTRRVRRCCG